MKGIMMTPANHRATEDGVKTVTRRLDGLKEINHEPDIWLCDGQQLDGTFFFKAILLGLACAVRSHYDVGETAYIKEAIYQKGDFTYYKLDDTMVFWLQSSIPYHWRWQSKILSPMFLPEDAARHFVTVKNIRAERLQLITEADAIAEGIMTSERTGRYLPGNCDYADWAYHLLWDKIYPKNPWDTNPWVLRYEYIRIITEGGNDARTNRK